jgi:hypothetical protein
MTKHESKVCKHCHHRRSVQDFPTDNHGRIDVQRCYECHPPPATPAERKHVTGTKDFTVTRAGEVWRGNQRQEITYWLGGLPSVDLGQGYHGPLRPSNDARRKWGDHKDDIDESGEDDHSTHRLLEEVVASSFLGEPPRGWSLMYVAHRDGDVRNNHLDNLYYAVMPHAEADRKRKIILGYMRDENSSRRDMYVIGGDLGNAVETEPRHRTIYVGARNIPGNLPTPSKGQQ